LKIGRIGFPETLVQNYHSTLRNIPEEHRSQEGVLSVNNLFFMEEAWWHLSGYINGQKVAYAVLTAHIL
jgi:hypothetical protein